MSDTAPVCGLVSEAPAPSKDANPLPYVPIARDLQSAIRSINALRSWFYGPHGPNSLRPGDYKEVNRVSEVVRVVNPDDKDQYIDVKRINYVVMKDKKTGSKWVWKR